MKQYFSSLVIFLLFCSSINPALACRPDIGGILTESKNEIVEALQPMYAISPSDIADIYQVDVNMKWIHTDSGRDCPDQYVLQFQVLLKDNRLFDITYITGIDSEIKVVELK
ncbi:hypothetical protein [Pseudoalteromonas sp. Of7M-16]|uniref:hypothetical protein n=1 Tax=Pseudoalteromonas sp. Of7M-16 TaxID=2917756 RepID=UPI001EF752A8|nr:hypothetical protein [Pseudoalteromonas sp. Of7M-16]MCG7547874.1 hypothetical protein [Pseudoalteromonas sp. Of7M-16]